MKVAAFKKTGWLKIGTLLLVYVVLFSLGYWGGGWLTQMLAMYFGNDTHSNLFPVLIIGLAIYAVLLAIPFVPGMEMSLALFALFGPKIAIALYLATILALSLSFLAGRMMPLSLIASIFGTLGFDRAKNLISKIQPLTAHQKLDFLIDHAPKRIAPTLLKHHYIAIIIALNIPGNAIIGGGGGIGLLAGIVKFYTFPKYIAAVSLATLPVPLFIYMMSDYKLW